MKILVVVDVQNDFIDGVLGTKEALQIIEPVINKIKKFDGTVLATRDTHFENYMETQEGKSLPVKHCIKDTEGWQIQAKVAKLLKTAPIDKLTFGSKKLPGIIEELVGSEPLESITLVGLCTDIWCDFQCDGFKGIFPGSSGHCGCGRCAGVSPEKP